MSHSDHEILTGDFLEGLKSLRSHQAELRHMKSADLIHGLVHASEKLQDSTSAIGKKAREKLRVSTGLTIEMIEYVLSLELSKIKTSVLEQLLENQRKSKKEDYFHSNALTYLVLAGNVFTASLRPLCFALLDRSAVIIKTSSREKIFPYLFKEALDQINEEIGRCIEIIDFKGGTRDIEAALYNEVDKVEAFGSDQTLQAIHPFIKNSCLWVPHGHGLGVIFISKQFLESSISMKEIMRRMAWDVCAFDQQGCLSPQVIFMEENNTYSGQQLAQIFSEQGLMYVDEQVPRGEVPRESQAEILQWLGVASVQGKVFRGKTHAVSWEAKSQFRPSPGFRNIQLLSCKNVNHFVSKIQGFKTHLKSTGVAGTENIKEQIRKNLPAEMKPRICEVGQMQMHSFLEPWDGIEPCK